MQPEYTSGPLGGRFVTAACKHCGVHFTRRVRPTDKPTHHKFCSRACGRQHQYVPRANKVCLGCGQDYPIEEFPVVAGSHERPRHSGHCRACYNDRNKRYQRSYGNRYYERHKANERRCREEVIAHYSAGTNRCACCGEARYEFLAVDHIEGGGHTHRQENRRRGTGIIRWLLKHNFPEGFRILCHNCNLARGFYGYCPHERESLVGLDAGCLLEAAQ